MYARLGITCQPKLSQLLIRAPFLFDSGAVSPDLFFNSPISVCASRGEVALMYAVLEDAVRCFQEQFVSGGQHAKRLGREAEAWFFSEDYKWPFSFVNICAVLGLDTEYIRQGLLRWRQRPPVQSRKNRWRAVVSGRRPLSSAA
jgi:hypothetical protein